MNNTTTGRNFPYWRNWVWANPTAPNLYWDVYSQEERWKKLCMRLHKLECYLQEVVDVTMDDLFDKVTEYTLIVQELQANFDVLTEYVDQLNIQIINIGNDLVAEYNRATAAEQDLQDQIDAIDTNITVIGGDISAEINRATAAEIAETNRATTAEGLLDDRCDDLADMIGDITLKLLSSFTYTPATRALRIELVDGTPFTASLPLATTVLPGLMSPEDKSKVDSISSLDTYRGVFGVNGSTYPTPPATTPDPLFSDGLANDGDWCYVQDSSTDEIWLNVIGVDGSGNCTYSPIIKIESTIAPATTTDYGMVKYDGTSVTVNAAGQLEVVGFGDGFVPVDPTEKSNPLVSDYFYIQNGSDNTPKKTKLADMLSWVVARLDSVYCPYMVGQTITTSVLANPSTRWTSTTWERVAQGKVLVGVDDTDVNIVSPDLTVGQVNPAVGAHNHTATFAGNALPAHNHTQNAHNHTQNAHSHNVGSNIINSSGGGKGWTSATQSGWLPSDVGASAGTNAKKLDVFDGSNNWVGGAARFYNNNPDRDVHVAAVVLRVDSQTPTNQATTATNNAISAGTPSGSVTVASSPTPSNHNNWQPSYTQYIWKRTA